MDESEVLQALTAIYDEADRAFQQKDLGKIADIMSPDFKGTSAEGKQVDQKSVLQVLATEFEQLNDFSFPRTITALRVNGNLATAAVEGVFQVRLRDGKMVVRRKVAEDVWTHGSAGWQMLKSTERSSEAVPA